MTAQFLHNELTNLVQEAKRKNSDLRQAAEKSLQDLKSIPPTADVSVGRERDIDWVFLIELSSKAGFVTPFVIACGTRNTKFSTIGIVCLQRLITSKALAKSRLREILEAFGEATNLGVDIQLKILQALPPLLQNYAGDLQGPLLGEALLICAILQGSKMGVVNNTAVATLSQIVISIFDKVVVEDERALEVPTTGEAPSEDGTIPVRPAALDAYRVFYDLCLLTEGQKPMFLRFNNLPQPFGLELIESVLTNHPDIFLSHPEQAHILRTRVAPLVMRALSERLNFPTTVRITRVLYILLRRHLSILSSECEISLGLLTQILEPDSSQPWKRALCMEVFKGICAEPALVRKIFSEYDAKADRKPVIKELMGAMTRLATEKPSVIGLGTQSSTPLNQQLVKDSSSEAAALEAGGVAGIIGGAVGLEANVTGLGAWSVIRVPCIDQLDKIEPPSIPDSYIYYLTLICLNSFSEGLAKFVLPLASSSDSMKRRSKMIASGHGHTGSDSDSTAGPAAPDRGSTSSPAKQQLQLKRKPTTRSSRVPVNPLSLEAHPLYAEIVVASGLVDSCWPAVLAACSTFLYATLDNELYHGLVRAFQKFTQVAGVFGLNTPRDAFLTTIGKAAVPSNVFSANVHSSSTTHSAPNESMFSSAKGLLGVESSNTGTGGTTNSTADQTAPSLNVRNLLCLRALLNLGIVLGPTLETSWTIVLETLQQADYVIFTSIRRGGRTPNPSSRTESQKVSDSASLMSNIMNELQAVEVAAGKMFEGTRDFPDEAFVAILSACCKLLTPDDERSRVSIDNPLSPRSGGPGHKRLPSMPGSTVSQVIGDHAFALAKLNELAQLNIDRLVGPNPETSGWNNLTNYLVSLTGTREMGSNVRLKAIQVLNEVIVAAAKAVPTENPDNVANAQRRILVALKAGVDYSHQPGDSDAMTKQTELEIHRAGLEALNAILEHQGQSLVAGWDIAFDIITSVFDSTMVWRRDSTAPVSPESIPIDPSARSSKSGTLVRSSFSSLELICSDFLASIPTSCILVLIDALFAFCSQKDDLNISLTTITFFWNVSDFLQSKGDSEQLTKGDALTSQAENERDLLDIVETQDVDSRSSLWMLLLLRLASVSKDARAEVRNGSIQTLFRIFDTYGHQLGPQGWSSCLKIVVFRMMNIDPKDLALYSSSGNVERRQWDDTIKLVLGGIGTLYSNYFDIFTQQANFANTWSVFIKYLETLLGWKSFEVSTTVFNVLARVLDQVKQPENLASESRDEVWMLWSAQGVKFIEGSVSSSTSSSATGIQEALKAYVDAFKPLYRLLDPSLSAGLVQKSLDILKECVLYPDAPSYFQDIDMVTPLQASILDCVKIIRTDIPRVPSLLLNMISQFAVVAYNTRPPIVESGGKKRLPTCIALSTHSMELMEKIAVKHIEDPDIYTSSTMTMTLKSLEVPIGLKYNFAPATASPALKRSNQWSFATQVVLKISRSALSAMVKLDLPDEVRGDVWTTIVKIAGSIVCASNTKAIDESVLRKDEAFDIAAFRELRELIITGLGQWVVPDATVLQYVEAVFWSSMLYDIAGESDPKEWLGPKMHGSTGELVLERRYKMSYVCIDELFSLVSVPDGGDEALKRVAAIAAPWLIRRVALVLRSYIADQPLRGRMPQPVRQREEMMYVLREMIKLDSGLGTVETETPCIPPSSKRLLFKLFPLFTKCIAVAQGDHELLALISRALGEMGGALGVC
ncbi:hypothetical protein EDC01DRAFT_613157 [Geopyxis carbonaria]|nr:hypothetical protein EDC01DRAFT_613157 [Geopyxis carbonaria]